MLKAIKVVLTCPDPIRISQKPLNVLYALQTNPFLPPGVLISLFALYGKGLVERALQLARQAGARVVIHMGTFEVVRAFRSEILGLFREHGPVDLLIGNEVGLGCFCIVFWVMSFRERAGVL